MNNKYPYLFVLFILSIFSLDSYAEIQKGKWEFVKDDEYCFIQSAPIKTEIPKGKSRGDHYIFVYRMHKNPDLFIQITAGYNYKSVDSVNVKIDDGNYDFWTDADTAWAKDDNEVVYAMKKGLVLITEGISSKGTKVTDTYTLKGFTSAINKLSKDC